jgi:hypothetical protein
VGKEDEIGQQLVNHRDRRVFFLPLKFNNADKGPGPKRVV